MAVMRPYLGLPALYLAHGGASVEAGAGWYFNFEYDRERERGLDFAEDLFNPLVLHFAAGSVTAVIASTVPHVAGEVEGMREKELARRAAIVVGTDGMTQRLT